jgi:hypothetical protein
LNENGYCQDHITPGHSKISQAGYGAFATRDLPKGTIVGYAPLIHIGEQGREIWDIVYEEGAGGINETRHLYDLVINYSFGHANSSVLLTPYGGTYMHSFFAHVHAFQTMDYLFSSRQTVSFCALMNRHGELY